MAYYVFKPLGVSQIVALPATSVAAVSGDAPTPDNCHTLILLNTSTTDAVLFGFGAPGVALVEGTTGSRLPAGSAISLAIGTLTMRGDMTGATKQVLATSLGAGAVTVDITYVCQTGSI
jgi:hypothetical protein